MRGQGRAESLGMSRPLTGPHSRRHGWLAAHGRAELTSDPCMQGALSVGRGHGDNVHLTERQNISRIDGLPIARGLKGLSIWGKTAGNLAAHRPRRLPASPPADLTTCQPCRLPTSPPARSSCTEHCLARERRR